MHFMLSDRMIERERQRERETEREREIERERERERDCPVYLPNFDCILCRVVSS